MSAQTKPCPTNRGEMGAWADEAIAGCHQSIKELSASYIALDVNDPLRNEIDLEISKQDKLLRMAKEIKAMATPSGL